MEPKKGIYDIAEICKFHSVETAVMCPGSRCAPLTLAFSRTKDINCITIIDERSAGFIALGIAETTQKPVVLICTSGTAVLNFAPAIAEAFFRKIPLLVITADRPFRMVGQQDGQTIHQANIFGKNCKNSYLLEGDIHSQDELDYLHRVVNTALIEATGKAQGPVHLNVTFEEPLYTIEKSDQQPRFIKPLHSIESFSEELEGWLTQYSRFLILSGSGITERKVHVQLNQLGDKLPILAEAISNIHGDTIIKNANEILRFSTTEGKEILKPEILITFGNGIVSKSVKIFLKSCKPYVHLHLSPDGEIIDTYQSLTHVLSVPLVDALSLLNQQLSENNFEATFLNDWANFSAVTRNRVNEISNNLFFSDFKSVEFISERIPDDSLLHVGNSMAIRYVNIFANSISPSVHIFCNRGTSGIDGSISTAIGNAIGSGKPLWVIVGDLSFHYDGNALWNKYVPKGVRIIILNNSGGGIFRLIEGPSTVPELSERFEAHIKNSADNKAKEVGFEYYSCDSQQGLSDVWSEFSKVGEKGKILEIFTDPQTNSNVFNSFQKQLNTII